MFYVRSAPCPVPNLQSSLPCTLDAVAPVRWPAPSPRTVCPPFDSRQDASAFDQPLSFDTSSVTDMNMMFEVRSSPCPAPNLQSSPRLHAVCAAVARRSAASRPHRTPQRMRPLFDSRQGANKFNQPLSFNTSSVTTMAYMFDVRSSPCPAPNLHSRPPLHVRRSHPITRRRA